MEKLNSKALWIVDWIQAKNKGTHKSTRKLSDSDEVLNKNL